MTVARLRKELGGVSELSQWMAYLELEPPEETGWRQSAEICHTVALAAGCKKVNREQFMPAFDKSEPGKTDPAMQAQLAAFGSISDIPEHIRERFR